MIDKEMSPALQAVLLTARDLGASQSDLTALIWEAANILRAVKQEKPEAIKHSLDLIVMGLMHERGYIP